MEATKRIMVNTVVQYARSVVYMFLMLFTTRFVLSSLGHEGFGVYSLIGSTVFLLGFITNSLASSTQRFLSFASGNNAATHIRSIFANAFLLHVGIALALVVVMGAVGPWLLSRLNIPEGLRSSAAFVYAMVLVMVMLSFVASPVRALFIARENIVYVSVVEIIDSVMKFLGALALPLFPFESLRVYAVLMMGVALFNFFAYMVYGCLRFEECHVPRLSEYCPQIVRQLTGFALWNVYAVGAGVLRTQGFALVINRFLGTVMNASYGIALQVNNAVSFVVMSILNAMNPQLMRAEGEGDRARMRMLSTKESKYSFLVLGVLVIPLMMEMPSVLRFWLGNAPEGSVMFCRFILLALLIDQLTIGLTSANQAIGRIRNYSLLISTMRLLELPLAWLCLRMGLAPVSVMLAYVAVEILIGAVRLPFLKHTAGFSIRAYSAEVGLRSAPAVVCVVAASALAMLLPDALLRFVLTEVAGVTAGVMGIIAFSLSKEEWAWIVQLIGRRKRNGPAEAAAQENQPQEKETINNPQPQPTSKNND